MTYQLATTLVHAGEHKPNALGFAPTVAPIHTSTTFFYPNASALDEAFECGGESVVYTRHGNPTLQSLECAMAEAEGGRGAVATASGMSALYLALLAASTPRGSTEPQPRHFLVSNDLYGQTQSLLQRFFASQQVQVTYVDMTDHAAVQAMLDAHEPDVVLFESISNPLLKVADIETICKLAHEVDARVIVDATLSTPVLHQPLAQGADLVVHSATKYLSGHADATGGIIVARTSLLLDTARRYQNLVGAILGPFEARLISRGLKTLSLRVKQQCANAQLVAEALQSHKNISRVYYPGLKSHTQHALASLVFCGGRFGGMVSFDLCDGSRTCAYKFMDALKLLLPATSLGDVYSLVTYPPLSSHRDLPEATRRAYGIGDGLVRLSIGIEDASDIIDDIYQALDQL
jgi:cystathionine gamma-synthase/methionine-gamma-lyase